MSEFPIVADAGPLIGLARVGLLDVLRQLYQKVLIPDEVLRELRASDDRPGSVALRLAMKSGWLVTASVDDTERLSSLSVALDPGEAAAILLAAQHSCRFLLLDERRGRVIAKRRGVRVVGTGGVLLAAKQHGLLENVSAVLDRLAENGYRLSQDLRQEILMLAGEGSEIRS